jgi:hypothetical protein
LARNAIGVAATIASAPAASCESPPRSTRREATQRFARRVATLTVRKRAYPAARGVSPAWNVQDRLMTKLLVAETMKPTARADSYGAPDAKKIEKQVRFTM